MQENPRFIMVFIAIIAFLYPSVARSQQILFSNLGPQDAYDSGVSYAVRGPAAYGERQWIADRFTLADGVYRLDEAALPLIRDSGTDRMNLFLLSDAGGLPGMVLDTFTLTGIPSQSSALLSAYSTQHPLLTGGTAYWFGVTPTSDTEARWFLNSTGQLGPCAENSLGLWSAETPDPMQGAFQLSGVLVSGSATPEPGTWALLGSSLGVGLCMLQRARRARKRE